MDERVASGGMPSNGHKPASANGQRGNGPAPAPPARKPRRALKNWSVRSRLLLLVIIPVAAAAVALGAIRIASSVQERPGVPRRIHQLADLSQKTTGLAQALQTERQDTVKFIVLGGSGSRAAALSSSRSAKATAAPELQVLRRDYTTSDNWASQVKQQAGSIGGSYSALTQQQVQGAVTAINGLGALRATAANSNLPALAVIQQYANEINQILALNGQVAVDEQRRHASEIDVRVVGLVSAMKEEASQSSRRSSPRRSLPTCSPWAQSRAGSDLGDQQCAGRAAGQPGGVQASPSSGHQQPSVRSSTTRCPDRP